MKSWSTKQHRSSPNQTGSHTHMLINVLIYKCTQPCTLSACLVSINSVISSHPLRCTHIHTKMLGHVRVYIYSATRRLPGADLRLTLNVPSSLWFLPVYDQELLVICLVRRSVYIMHVCVCLSLVSASWPPSLWQLVWLHDGWYWLLKLCLSHIQTYTVYRQSSVQSLGCLYVNVWEESP